MGHLLEAIKKLDQRGEAVRPKPVRRLPPAAHATTIWRFDQPHPVGAAHWTAELPGSGGADRAPTIAQTASIERRDVSISAPAAPAAPALVGAPEVPAGAGGGGRPSTDVGWRVAAPAVPSDYHRLAARLVAQAGGSQRPQSVLLTGVSGAALDAVSLAALAVVLSAQGSVLWIDARNIRPTPTTEGRVQGKNVGWGELCGRKAGWEEVIVPTSLPDISFVGRGDRSIEADGQQLERDLFEPLQSAFSFVLIGGGLVEESASLASICDVTGLIAAIGQARRSQIERALATLGAAGANSPLMIAVEPHGP